ncbi:hypothetical protein PEBR_31814 [Penicillium brasilianum]|uniref:Uncharacterized protein n=1 Tax=Penicillium brasilianum TaxID=104259 RepID=A0A1S9RF23_PENBI|nr:hypothetical protein PEBR_31814 [Penicillium brasilianum]
MIEGPSGRALQAHGIFQLDDRFFTRDGKGRFKASSSESSGEVWFPHDQTTDNDTTSEASFLALCDFPHPPSNALLIVARSSSGPERIKGRETSLTQVCADLEQRWTASFAPNLQALECSVLHIPLADSSSIQTLRKEYLMQISVWSDSLRGNRHIELVSTGRDGFLIDKEILLPFFVKFSAIQSWTIFLPSVGEFAHINLNALIGLWQNRDAPPPCIDRATNAIALFLDEAAKRRKALSEAGKTNGQLVTRGRNLIRRDRAPSFERERLR